MNKGPTKRDQGRSKAKGGGRMKLDGTEKRRGARVLWSRGKTLRSVSRAKVMFMDTKKQRKTVKKEKKGKLWKGGKHASEESTCVKGRLPKKTEFEKKRVAYRGTCYPHARRKKA